MTRRIGAALVGLALTLPIVAAPVAAHFWPSGYIIVFDTYEDGPNTHLIGTVENHNFIRGTDVNISATWFSATTEIHQRSALAFQSNLAPHAASPFHITALTANLTEADNLVLTAQSTTGGGKPVGALDVDSATINGPEDTVTGTVINDGTSDATNVVVYALVFDGATLIDTAGSAPIPTLTPGGAGSPYTIEFIRDIGTDAELFMVARSTSGPFFTSWNNFFSDLGLTNFADEIAFLADEGITTGCGNGNFCPAGNVTRAHMAVFLDRALDFPDAPDQGFEDLDGLSPGFIQAINNLAAEGLTGGCSTTPKNFCPGEQVTRGQMSKFIVLGYGLAPISGAGSFTDDDGHFSEPYNNRMAADGITSGCTATTYCPNRPVFREQMAAFLFRAETAQ